MNKQNKGITLIALVVTIIIIVILGGVSVSLIIGQNGIINKTIKANREYKYSVALEKLSLKIADFKANNIIEKKEDPTLEELAEYLGNSGETEIILKEYNKVAYTLLENIPNKLTNIVVQVVGYEEYQFLIEEECTVTKVSFDNGENFTKIDNLEDEEVILQSLAMQVQVGDYVAYNALAYNVEGNPYTYTSPEGTGLEHGNGYKEQTYTTKSDIKWRVLSKDASTGEVVLISEKSLMRDVTGYPFYMKGAISYLYAEEELNRICSIYGHGYGANIDKVFTCQTGDTVEGLDTVTLTGSGSRSINADDINNITGFDKTNDLVYAFNYGNTITHTVGYPTKTTVDGISTSIAERTETITSYVCFPRDYLDTTSPIYDILFGEIDDQSNAFGYWLASRSSDGGDSSAYFMIGEVKKYTRYNSEDQTYTEEPRISLSSHQFGYSIDDENKFSASGVQRGVRPIVYLKNTLKTSGKDENGAWKIIDQQ